jgi:hypothetical protein
LASLPWQDRTVSRYPFIVRNLVPDGQRAFVSLWVAILAVVTWKAFSAGPPDATNWWPWILLAFWLVGLLALRWAFTVEAARLVVERPRHARVERGPPFSRTHESLTRLDLAIVETRDGDGDPYFHLTVATSGGAAVVAESRRRDRLVAVKRKAEGAW